MKITFEEFLKVTFCFEIVLLLVTIAVHLYSFYVDNGFELMDYIYILSIGLVTSIFTHLVLLPIFAFIFSIGSKGE